MKILHVCLGNYYADDYGYQENYLTKYNHDEGNDVLILASRKNYDKKGNAILTNPGEYFNRDGIRVVRVNYSRLPFSKLLKIYRNYKQYVRDFCPDFIFLHNIQFSSALFFAKYKKKNEIRMVADNHGDSINSARNMFSKMLHKLYWKFIVRCVDSSIEKYYGVLPARCSFLNDFYGVPLKKIEYLPLGVDDRNIRFQDYGVIRKAIRQKYHINESDFLFITGGRIDSRKRIIELMETFKKSDNKNIKLMVFGSPVAELRERYENFEADNVLKIGKLDPNEIYRYFFASDMGVFPGTHSVLWEQAVGCGLPCIFNKMDSFSHVDIGGNCIIRDCSQLESLADLINEIPYSELYERMRVNAQSTKKERFYYSVISRQYL